MKLPHRMMPSRLLAAKAALLATCFSTLLGVPLAEAADHRDGPMLTGRNTLFIGNLDINDLYIFRGSNTRNTVMAITAGPAAGVLAPPVFAPGAFYEFRIDNTGDNVDDLLIQVVFSDFDRFLRQNYQVRMFDIATGQGRVLANSITGRTTALQGGGMVQAGIFDDPFFFNFTGYSFFRRTALGEETLPPGMTSTSLLVPPAPPVNTFGNFNTLAIVLEIPSRRLTSSRNNPNIGVWTRTVTADGLTQVDRMGLPAINTVAVPTALQGDFNRLTPGQDPSLRAGAAAFLVQLYGLDTATATTLANTVLPDRMPFDVTSSEGFNNTSLELTLNGRRLDDDVVDAAFNALTGGALPTDFVVNDSVFRNTFPYLGRPLPPSRVGF